MISCYILDDEPSSVDLMKKYIERTAILELTGSETDAVTGIKQLLDWKPDLVFLDIQMPGCSGMDVAAQLPSSTKIIFTTAYRNYGADAYDLNAIDFLSKPISYQRFMVAVNKYAAHYAPRGNNMDSSPKETKYLFVPIGKKGMRIKIEPDTIILFEAKEHYSVAYLENGQILSIALSISEMEVLLPGNFKRVQRSFVANMQKVECIQGNDLEFVAIKKKIACGREYIKPVKKYLGFL